MGENNYEYIIDISKLRLGDIILAIFDRRIAVAMDRVTGSPYHHAMIVAGDATVIHSGNEGVHSANPLRMVFEKPEDVVVVRHGEMPSLDKLIDASNLVRKKIGTTYSADERDRVRNAGDQQSLEPNRQFCTRLVAQAYRDVGLPLVENADYCTPNELLKSDKVEVLENILTKGNPAQLKYANEKSEALEKQDQATNYILEQTRQIAKVDIQSLQQLEEFVENNPEFDAQLTAVVIESGYLELIDIDMKKNPEHYGFQVMKNKIPKKYWINVASQQIPIAEGMAHSAARELSRLQVKFASQPLEFYKVHIELFKKLVEAFSKMERTMSRAITEALK